MPAHRDLAERGRIIAREAAVGLSQPVAQRAAVAAPQDIVAVVAVEVAGRDDVPAGRDLAVGRRIVGDEAAVGLAEPVAHRAAVAAPQYVAAPVAVEVARGGDVPAGRHLAHRRGVVAGEPAAQRPQPVAQRPAVAAPQDVAAPVAVEVAGIGARHDGRRDRSGERQLHAAAGRGAGENLARGNGRQGQRAAAVAERRAGQRKGEAGGVGIAEHDAVAA